MKEKFEAKRKTFMIQIIIGYFKDIFQCITRTILQFSIMNFEYFKDNIFQEGCRTNLSLMWENQGFYEQVLNYQPIVNA